MSKNLCLFGLLAVVGCAGSSSTTAPPVEVASQQPAASSQYAILVPNMT